MRHFNSLCAVLEVVNIASFFGYDIDAYENPYDEPINRKNLLSIYRENSKSFKQIANDEKYAAQRVSALLNNFNERFNGPNSVNLRKFT